MMTDDQTTAPSNSPDGQENPRTGMAVASLVLGILSIMCFGILAGIPGVITGHVALSRNKRDPRVFGGHGMALAGVILSYLSVALTLTLALILLPALSRAKEAALRSSCANNEKQLGLVFKMFANDHDGDFPELSGEAGRLMFNNHPVRSDDDVWPEYLDDLRVLYCPAHDDAYDLASAGSGDEERHIDDTSYFYLGYVVTNDAEVETFAEAYRERINDDEPFADNIVVSEGRGNAGGSVLFRIQEGVQRFLITDINSPPDPSTPSDSTIPVLIERPENHVPMGGNVLYMDGHVEFISYPGDWPMTETTIGILESLDAM